MIGFLEKLTLNPQDVTDADLIPVRAAGVSDEAIEDAIHVCALFNIIDRMADSLGFDVPGRDAFAETATRLLRRGYR